MESPSPSRELIPIFVRRRKKPNQVDKPDSSTQAATLSLPPIYDHARPFRNGRAAVGLGKYGAQSTSWEIWLFLQDSVDRSCSLRGSRNSRCRATGVALSISMEMLSFQPVTGLSATSATASHAFSPASFMGSSTGSARGSDSAFSSKKHVPFPKGSQP